MAGLFTAEVIGRLGTTLELRQGKNGTEYLYFRVAANLSSSMTQWFACFAPQNLLAEETMQRMSVGAEVFIRAHRVSIRAFTGASGSASYTVGLEVSEVKVLHYPDSHPVVPPAATKGDTSNMPFPEASISDYYKNFDL